MLVKVKLGEAVSCVGLDRKRSMLEGCVWVESQDLPHSAPDLDRPPYDFKIRTFALSEDGTERYRVFGLWTAGTPGEIFADVFEQVELCEEDS